MSQQQQNLLYAIESQQVITEAKERSDYSKNNLTVASYRNDNGLDEPVSAGLPSAAKPSPKDEIKSCR